MHRLIRWALLACSLILAGCIGGGQAAGSFRQANAPIWSAAALDQARLAGDWRQVAGLAGAPGGCRQGGLHIAPATNGLRLSGSLCLNGRVERVRALAREAGPGRLSVGGEEWWVLWVDSGYRTLVLGTPSGRFGVILDRGTIPQDRLEAAREILDFNGYDTGALQSF